MMTVFSIIFREVYIKACCSIWTFFHDLYSTTWQFFCTDNAIINVIQ